MSCTSSLYSPEGICIVFDQCNLNHALYVLRLIRVMPEPQTIGLRLSVSDYRSQTIGLRLSVHLQIHWLFGQ